MGQILFKIDLPVGKMWSTATYGGALGAPTIGKVLGTLTNQLIINSINAGVILYDLPGSENAAIYWGTGRGNFNRDGNYDYSTIQNNNTHVVSKSNFIEFSIWSVILIIFLNIIK
jgi:hypothetical protein